ncbi:MAG: hypothetical protein JEZ07_06430 [Phycisphaerae bacterium]|nr:hypothetical protein [Phycisphaerae bacterium]
MAFTTWAALKQQILDGISAGTVLTSSYSYSGQQREFRSMKEVTDFLVFIDYQIASESGNNGPGIVEFEA